MDHLIGVQVGIPLDTQQALGVSWETAIIVAVFSAERGVGVHLLGAEGIITPAVGLEAVTLPDTMASVAWLHDRLGH